MTVHEIRGVRSQEHRRPHEIFRCAPTCSGRFGENECIKRVTATVGLAFTQRRGLLGGDIARPYAVALYVMFAILG